MLLTSNGSLQVRGRHWNILNLTDSNRPLTVIRERRSVASELKDPAIAVKERILIQKFSIIAVITIVCSLFSGCTSQQLYGTGQEYQRNRCLHIPDKIESDRCLSKINTSYDDYKREKDSGTK